MSDCICGGSKDKPNPECERCQLVAEIERLRAKCELTYCAYCGAEFPLDGDATDIGQHIATCEKHPMRKVEQERDEAREQIAALHPRVWKLAAKGEFVCVGQHEPYYMQVLDLIREHEIRKGTWTEEDRIWYMAQKMEATDYP